jgi:hypothetical protein
VTVVNPCLLSEALSHEQLREQNAWLDVPDSFDNNDTTFGAYEDDILHGRIATEISHASESAQEDAAADSQILLEKLCAHHKCILFLFFFFWDFSDLKNPQLALCQTPQHTKPEQQDTTSSQSIHRANGTND